MKTVSPEPLLKHGRNLWEACALFAGVRLGVFEALRDGPLAPVTGSPRPGRPSRPRSSPASSGSLSGA